MALYSCGDTLQDDTIPIPGLAKFTGSRGLLRKNEDSKTIMTTVIPGNAANQLDVAKRSYLDALTTVEVENELTLFDSLKVGLIYCYDSSFGWLLYRHHRYFFCHNSRS